MAKSKLIGKLNEGLTKISRKPAWSTGLLILSSAALGGIAVALWNRKTLATFHELEFKELPVQSGREDADWPDDLY